MPKEYDFSKWSYGKLRARKIKLQNAENASEVIDEFVAILKEMSKRQKTN